MPSLHKQSKKDALIQFRLSSADKSTIHKAAALKGLEPSVYMRSLILESAKNELQKALEYNHVILSSEEWNHFEKVMKAPIKKNKNLKKAFTEYKKKYG